MTMQVIREKMSGITLVAGLLVLWEFSARVLVENSQSWPPFTDVMATLLASLGGSDLLSAMLASLGRMAAGFVIGSAVGIAIGLAMGLAAPVRALLNTLVELLRPIPAAAIIPPLIFILGIDNTLKIFIISLGVFFPVVVNTLAGAMTVDPTYLEVARTFKAGRARTLRRVLLPAALPYILAGMRTSLALALITTVVAEMIAGSGGIGYYIISMQYAMRADDMYAAVILLSLTGYAMNLLFRMVEGRLLHWTGK
ncbi:ABC transporter permease [Palleronia sp. LCG004]|uniref:ABC transporter permease n=1 Tax=Palleronia sp. LCG004 TaxID=3079304 RepID=UPI002943D98B|nr:ABC transporter permease [Palleronia sp. LCG004]WOI57865.1 ABC transporter permease [Palleronia sp. LCG004]